MTLDNSLINKIGWFPYLHVEVNHLGESVRGDGRVHGAADEDEVVACQGLNIHLDDTDIDTTKYCISVFKSLIEGYILMLLLGH